MSLALTFRHVIQVDAPAAQLFDYLADFTTTNEWDPRASNTVRRTGDGTEGTEYACDVRFLGRTTHMDYTITRLDRPRQIEWAGRNRAVRALDTIDLDEVAPGVTSLTYSAAFTYATLPIWATLLLAVPLQRLCADARHGLQHTLHQRFGDGGQR